MVRSTSAKRSARSVERGAIDASTGPPVRYERNRIAARLVAELPTLACPEPFEYRDLFVFGLRQEVFQRGFGKRTE